MEDRGIQRQEYKKSTYSDFMGEAQGLIQLKRGFEDTLLGDLEEQAMRERIARYAMILITELGSLPTDSERAELNNIVTKLKALDESISKKEVAPSGCAP